MDLEDDTTVLTTLKSFNSFLSRSEPQQRLSEPSVSGSLQGQYKRSMEVCVNLHHQWCGDGTVHGICAYRYISILVIAMS